MSTTIPPSVIFGWIDQGDGQSLDDLLEQQPESPEACLAVCYAMRRGIHFAIEDDDDDELALIFEWGEQVLTPHSAMRQMWALDEVAAHERSQGLSPEQQAAWSLAREQAVSELTTN